MRLLFPVFALFLCCSALIGQGLRRFTPEKEAYMQELRDYLKAENDLDEEEQLDPLLARFSTVFLASTFSAEEEKELYQLSDEMKVRKRITAFAAWYNLLDILENFETQQEEGATLPFLANLRAYADANPARRITDYLAALQLTLSRQVLYDNDRVRWEVIGEAPGYRFDNEPVFTFEAADLWAYFRNDSTVLEGVDLEYRPQQYRLQGKGGTAYFLRAGLTADSAYVELSQFSLDVRKADYRADSATLFSKYYLKEPVLGSFEEKLTSLSDDEDRAVFPRFRSYRYNIVVPSVLPYANFEGGVSVIGNKFYGIGNEQFKAKLLFNYKDTLLIRARSDRFRIRYDKVFSENVETTIYLKKDSIYHPRLTLRYLPERKQVTLIREDEGMGAAPFSDSYHALDMKFEIFNWEVGSPLVSLGNLNIGGGEAPVVFESKRYFREKRFNEIEGMSRRSPLVSLKNMSEQQGYRREFSTEEVARYLRMDESNAHIFLMRMAILGFVDYRVDDRQAILKDKVFDYILHMKRVRDYDVIQFVSRVGEGNNAKMSLETFDMEVEGIRAIALSDSQAVGLFPYGGKITLKKGLDFDFDGRISAGRFNYWGKDFKFSYDNFMVSMEDIDSMRFKVRSFEPNNFGEYYLVDVKTVLQDLTGELLIDKPNNKSGKEIYSEYPIFRSGNESFVYYDKPGIFNGVYERESFFVRLEPFEIDSLDNTTTNGLSFDGTFTSAGIFPDLNQVIKVQPDYSLGFTTETPAEGLSAYGGKGSFAQTLSLSNEGLRGQGQIDYLNSQAWGEEFFFFPDSTKGLAQNYEIERKLGGAGSNPHVTGLAVDLHWVPYDDVLYTYSREQKFALYDDIGMQGSGRLAHGPDGLRGRGLMEFLNAETRSKDYTFESRKLLSPELAFRVRVNPQADWGFGLEKAQGEIDFDRERGFFSLLDTAQYFQFLANQYIAYMDYATWLIPEQAVTVKKQSGSAASSRMVSVKPEQDSLQFRAEFAKFYLTKTLLEGFQVPHIDVADARIVPDTGYVAIDTAANMRTLFNASLTASRDSQYHQFYGSTLKIQTRHNYYGKGDYEYLDKDGTPWPIFFKEIKADTGTTVGFAQLSKADAFYMSPYFAYHGNVYLRANRKLLDFRGYTHIETDCPSISTNWFQFHSLIDPANILIELPEIDPDDKTKTLANGVFLAADTISGYAAFLSSEVSPADRQMFFADGVLFYDEANSSYTVTTRERAEDDRVAANILRFRDVDCTMQGEGEMSLGERNSQMQIRAYGAIDYDLQTDDMLLDISLVFDFPFSEALQERMAELILTYGKGNGLDLTTPPFATASQFMLSAKDREELYQEIEDYGAPAEFPKDLRSTLFLGQMQLVWTPEAISFMNQGQVGLSSLGKELVNTQLKGTFELQRARGGDEWYLLVDVDISTFLFFEYRRGRLGIYSNDETLMTILKELDLKERRNEEKGMSPFTYMLSTEGKMNRFIRRYEMFNE